MRRFRWQLLAVAVVVLLSGLVAWWVQRNTHTSGPDLYDMAALQKAMARHGLEVKSSAETNTYALFPGLGPGSAWGLLTAEGHMDVIFFSEPVEGRLSVQEVGQFDWKIQGWTDSPRELGSNRPIYFTIHRNLFIKTDSQPLHTRVRHALGARS